MQAYKIVKKWDGDVLMLKDLPFDKNELIEIIIVTVSSREENGTEQQTILQYKIKKYDKPFDAASSEEDWEA